MLAARVDDHGARHARVPSREPPRRHHERARRREHGHRDDGEAQEQQTDVRRPPERDGRGLRRADEVRGGKDQPPGVSPRQQVDDQRSGEQDQRRERAGASHDHQLTRSRAAPPKVGAQPGIERRVGEHADVVDAIRRASRAPPLQEGADRFPVRPARRGAVGEHQAPGLRDPPAPPRHETAARPRPGSARERRRPRGRCAPRASGRARRHRARRRDRR